MEIVGVSCGMIGVVKLAANHSTTNSHNFHLLIRDWSNISTGVYSIVWKRISVMVCNKSAYPNCSGRVITAPEDL